MFFFFLRWSLWHFRGPGCFKRPGHLLPGERRPAGRVRRPVGPQRRSDGEREGVGDAVHGYDGVNLMLLRYRLVSGDADGSMEFMIYYGIKKNKIEPTLGYFIILCFFFLCFTS